MLHHEPPGATEPQSKRKLVSVLQAVQIVDARRSESDNRESYKQRKKEIAPSPPFRGRIRERA